MQSFPSSSGVPLQKPGNPRKAKAMKTPYWLSTSFLFCLLGLIPGMAFAEKAVSIAGVYPSLTNALQGLPVLDRRRSNSDTLFGGRIVSRVSHLQGAEDFHFAKQVEPELGDPANDLIQQLKINIAVSELLARFVLQFLGYALRDALGGYGLQKLIALKALKLSCRVRESHLA